MLRLPAAALISALTFTLLVPAGVAVAAVAEPSAQQVLNSLRVAAPSTATYNRDLFVHWIDADSNGCDTRQEVLKAESVITPIIGPNCSVSGQWDSWYDGASWTNPADVDIDHFVPLGEAWRSGADAWSSTTRQAFANDLDFGPALVAVTDNVNQSKGDSDPAGWLPPAARSHCQYATEWVLVKYRWQLAVDSTERATLASLLNGSCGAATVVLPSIVGPATPVQPSAGPTAIGTGAVSIKGPSSELIPGVTVEIRRDSCQGPAVWLTTTSTRPDAYGAFGIGLAAGQYCIRTLAVPAPYTPPADVVFTMEERPANWVTVWVPRPVAKAIVTGALVAKNGQGVPINGVTAHIREGTCAGAGQGVWQNTTAANRWAQGGFGISLSEGLHCVTTLGVPSGYETPAPFEVTVVSPSPYWLTVWVPGSGPWVPPPGPTERYYANCAAVRAAGAAPLYAGQPGYETPRLDRDGDGVACE